MCLGFWFRCVFVMLLEIDCWLFCGNGWFCFEILGVFFCLKLWKCVCEVIFYSAWRGLYLLTVKCLISHFLCRVLGILVVYAVHYENICDFLPKFWYAWFGCAHFVWLLWSWWFSAVATPHRQTWMNSLGEMWFKEGWNEVLSWQLKIVGCVILISRSMIYILALFEGFWGDDTSLIYECAP